MKKISMFPFFIPAILVLSACGSEDQTTQNQAEPYVMQYLPKQNSVVIPKSLLGKQVKSSERTFRTIENSGETDSAFAKVNHRVTEAEVSRLSNQMPLLMLDAVWLEIQSQCENIASGVVCTIPQGTIILQLTDGIIAAAEAILEKIDAINNQQDGASFEVSKPKLSMTSGDSIGLGTIIYTALPEESGFQYEVSLNLFEMEKIEGLVDENVTTLLLKWSAQEDNVVSSYGFESSDLKYVYTYNYLDGSDEESVKIQYNGTDDSLENLPNTYTAVVTLKTLDGSNNATLVEFEWRQSGELGMQSIFAVGEADNDDGSLQTDFSSDYNSEGKVKLVSYSQKETFDNKGVVINSALCEANCESQEAWISAGSTTSSGNTTTINGDKNETTTTITETVTESPLIDIVVSGLEDGSYIIASDGFDGDDRLGRGSVTEGVATFIYWGGEAKVGNAKVYTFQLIRDEAGYRPGYIEMDAAQITVVD